MAWLAWCDYHGGPWDYPFEGQCCNGANPENCVRAVFVQAHLGPPIERASRRFDNTMTADIFPAERVEMIRFLRGDRKI
jgi:hypothetical protein